MKKIQLTLMILIAASLSAIPVFADRELLTDEALGSITGQSNIEEFKPVQPVVVRNKKKGITKSVFHNIFRSSESDNFQFDNYSGDFNYNIVVKEKNGLSEKVEQRRNMNIYMNEAGTVNTYKGLKRSGIDFDSMFLLIYRNISFN